MMNALLNFYYKLPHDRSLGIVTKAFNRLVAKLIKRVLDKTVPNYFLKTQHLYPNGLNAEKREKKVVISLTSFPARIQDVWIVVECLFRQTYKADKIILWLSESQFIGSKLPDTLLNQLERGLDIRFVDGDLKSHKKYIYAIDEFPKDYIITVDDDLYYNNKLIENLINLKLQFPDAVPSNRCHEITLNKNNTINNYSRWYHNSINIEPSYFLSQTGGFGTLYTANDLYVDYNNTAVINQLMPYADDLWLKVQTLLKDKKIVTNSRYDKDPITVKNSQLEKLVTKNVLEGGNDIQLRNTLNYYKLYNLEYFIGK